MKYHVEKHKDNPRKWVIVDEDGLTVMEAKFKSNADFYAKLLNSRHNKTTTP